MTVPYRQPYSQSQRDTRDGRGPMTAGTKALHREM